MKANADNIYIFKYTAQTLMFHFLPLILVSHQVWSQKVFVRVRNPRKNRLLPRSRLWHAIHSKRRNKKCWKFNFLCEIVLSFEFEYRKYIISIQHFISYEKTLCTPTKAFSQNRRFIRPAKVHVLHFLYCGYDPRSGYIPRHAFAIFCLTLMFQFLL